MRISILVLACGILAGCATRAPEPEIVVQEVKVPVVQPCITSVPASPKFKFAELSTSDSIETKVRVLLHDRILHIAYEQELTAALGVCK